MLLQTNNTDKLTDLPETKLTEETLTSPTISQHTLDLCTTISQHTLDLCTTTLEVNDLPEIRTNKLDWRALERTFGMRVGGNREEVCSSTIKTLPETVKAKPRAWELTATATTLPSSGYDPLDWHGGTTRIQRNPPGVRENIASHHERGTIGRITPALIIRNGIPTSREHGSRVQVPGCSPD